MQRPLFFVPAEHELETALELVKKNWSAQKFLVNPYQKNLNKDNVFILGDTEEIGELSF